MTAFSDIVTGPDNHPIPGVKVYVYTKAGVLAFSEPFTTDQFGRFNFAVADGVYRLDYWFGGKKVDSEDRIIGNPPEFKGDPGGNAMAVGSFAALSGLSIPVGTDLIRTSEHRASSRKGGAFYRYDVAVDAAFVAAHPGWSVITANGRGFRLDSEQTVLFEMFGAYGNATLTSAGTDDYPAWLKAKDFIHYHRAYPAGNYYYKPSVRVNFAIAGYEFSSYLDLNDAAYELIGTGSTGGGAGGGTCFFFSGTCGIILQSWDTAGVNLINQTNNAGTPHGASNSRIRDITPISRPGTLGAEQHGLIVKCFGVTIEGVQPIGFGGDGIHIFGNVPGQGNANCNYFIRCGGHNNGLNGIYVAAGDGNANVFISTQANNNRKYGIAECSFLGNHWIGYHVSGNGMPQSHGCGPDWSTPIPATSVPGARVRYGGHTYLVHPGQDTAAATTTPGTNSAVWVDQGTADPGYAEAWVSGHLYAAGGSVYIGGNGFAVNNNNRSFMTGYQESDQAPGWGDSNCSIGIAGTGSTGPSLFGALGAIVSKILGSRAIRADGHIINAMLGGDPDNGNQWLQVGFDDAPAWSGKLDSAGNMYFDYNNGGASVPLIMNVGTGLPGAELPRGVKIGALTNAANDTAAATAGVAVGNAYRNGSILMIRVT